MTNSIANMLPDDLPEYWVYAVNVAYDRDEEQLKSFFSQMGPVIAVSFVYDRNGSKKGHVRIAYRKKEDAVRAIHDLHNVRYGGRAIKLNWDKTMVIRNSGATPEKVSEMIKKSELLRAVPIERVVPEVSEPEEYINNVSSSYRSSPSYTVDRLKESPYELLFKKQIDIADFPFIIPKDT